VFVLSGGEVNVFVFPVSFLAVISHNDKIKVQTFSIFQYTAFADIFVSLSIQFVIPLIMNFHNFRKKHIPLLLSCFFTLLLFSCGNGDDDTPSTVDSALEPYLDHFIEEGVKRGKILNINKKSGIIMEFADLTPPTIGLCYSSLPVRIQIDRTYWRETANSANRENLREDLVFHELGHGFLKRGHRNDSLPNNEWTSMMCGEPQVNERGWAVNFNGYRKNYYLDELFNENTPAPDWSNPVAFDGNKGYLWRFTDYSSLGPSSSTKGEFTLKTGNGVYEISSSDNENKLFPLYPLTLITADFYMEIEMFVSFGLKESLSGLFAGYQLELNQDINYFTISSGSRSAACNTKCTVAPFAEVLVIDKFQKESYNKLALCKRGGELFFYINDKLVYRNDYKLKGHSNDYQPYNMFGIAVPAKGSVFIRNLALYAEQPPVLRAGEPEKEVSVIRGVSIPGVDYLR
jgi:hypothetical protein